GAGGKCRGCGTVFRMDSSGKVKQLLRFSGGAKGYFPIYGVTRDSVGDLFGTTFYGGPPKACGGGGCGGLFKLNPAGEETVLYTFQGSADGGHVSGDLLRDAAGNIYGTGGSVAFKLDPKG